MFKLGDKVFHKSNLSQEMFISRLWSKSNSFPAEATVEYFDEDDKAYYSQRFSQANLIKGEDNIEKFMKGNSSLHVDSKLRHSNKSEPVLYSTPKSGTVGPKSDFNWIARDKDGWLFKTRHKPTLNKDHNKYLFDGIHVNIDRKLYPQVTFENSPQPWPLKEEKSIKEDEELAIGEIGLMAGVKVECVKADESNHCSSCRFDKNMNCGLLAAGFNPRCNPEKRKDKLMINYREYKEEHQDLISLVLEKMPFLDSEEFKLVKNNGYEGRECVDIVSLNNHESYRIYGQDLETRGIKNAVKSFFNLD